MRIPAPHNLVWTGVASAYLWFLIIQAAEAVARGI